MPQKPHLYQWEDEPVDERPSEFASTTSTLASGFASAPPALRRRANRTGLRTMLTVTIALLALGGWLLHHWAQLLRHG
ncbi:MAG: hypothetical protein JSR59_00600 [Proteobacteria bacterium]|nr:hypothetical protein [Pseudomonadota bacterium]